MGAQVAYDIARDLECDRYRWLANWHRMPDRFGFLQVAIGLAPRQSEIARQRHGGVRQGDTAHKQAVGGVQSLGLLRVG